MLNSQNQKMSNGVNIVIQYTPKRLWTATLIVVILVLGSIIFFKRQPAQTPAPTIQPANTPKIPVQSEGVIDIDVRHDPVSTATTHTFMLAFTTHSGDLSTFDAQTNIVYRPQTGGEVQPQSIGGDIDTHHRVISATFTNTTFPGTIVVKNLRGVPERTFTINN